MTLAKGFAIAALVWLFVPSAALAHPGHGHGGGDFSLAHYLSEPGHLFFAIALTLLVLVAAGYVRETAMRSTSRYSRRRARRSSPAPSAPIQPTAADPAR